MTDAPKHPTVSDPANELASDNSVIDPRDFRNALGTYATGVTIITAAAADGKPYGLTCNSFASVSLNPPLVLWSLGMFSQGLSIFQNASHFTVNVLGASQQALATKFAKSSGDKFAGVEWKPGLGNAPILADSVATFQCRAANRYYGGDHVIFLAQLRPMPTTGRSRCCLRRAATAGSTVRHDPESPAQAYARQAEATFS
jgi:flavin reductase (DIM6/NTAB) family NADH-FMN oxidoreductase RutF